MSKQLPLRFEDEWWVEVLISLSEDGKGEAIIALKEMFVAYCEIKRGKGAKDGQCRD
jgi:hypothetical protein